MSTLGALLLEQLDGDDVRQLATLLATLLAPHIVETKTSDADRWLSTRDAAAHLGLTVNALQKKRDIPAAQDTPGGKLYYRRSDLDQWRSDRSTRY